jgi:hypothetical protein
MVRTILMHGVAPQCVVKVAYPSLGREAGGRSLGFISLMSSAEPRRARGNRRAGHLPTVQGGGKRRLVIDPI